MTNPASGRPEEAGTRPEDPAPALRQAVSPRALGFESTGIPALDSGMYLARQQNAAELLVLADGRLPLEALARAPKGLQLIFGVADEELIPYYSKGGLLAILSPGRFTSAVARVQYAIFRARAAGLLAPDGHVICVSAPTGSKHLNAIMDVDLAKEFEEASQVERYLSERGGRIDILTTLLDVAIELGMFGLEGKQVGTIFVYGSTAQVLRRSRQLTFNPYRGYSERSRNLALAEVRESLKIFAQMDGAIVVQDDGTVAAAGRFLLVPAGEAPIVKGKGTRHQAAAFISRETGALAIVVSETAGRVTLFSEGKSVFDLAPRAVR